MRLYSISFAGQRRWYGTQADANAAKRDVGVGWAEVDVPTDKAGLLAWLNKQQTAVHPVAARKAPAAADDRSATAVLSRVDNPSIDVDAVVETICRSRGYALKRFAAAVALAFGGLAR